MKISKASIQEGMKFKQKGKSLHLCRYEFDKDKFLKLEWLVANLEGSEIKITNKCKSYQGSGEMIRYTIDGQLGEFLSFWTDFKSNTEYIIDDDITISKQEPKKKGADKTWTDHQKNRLGESGYYITYYGIYDENPTQFGVTYIGEGKCLYIHWMNSDQDWNTLLWSCAPTKNKIELSEKNKLKKMDRFIYFRTHAELLAFKNLSVYKPMAMRAANIQEDRERVLNKLI